MEKNPIRFEVPNFLLFLMVVCLASCSMCDCPCSNEGAEKKTKLDENDFDTYLEKHNDTLFHMSDWSNPVWCDATWTPDCISFSEEGMNIRMDDVGCPTDCRDRSFRAGEYRTRNEINRGYVGAEMKIPSDAVGVMSGALFTYTDVGEIDIEFIGKKRGTMFQATLHISKPVWKPSISWNVDLDFDAEADFHEYGFLWDENLINWYVDKKLVLNYTGPDVPDKQKLMMSIWPGLQTNTGIVSWLGELDYKKPLDFKIRRLIYIEGAKTYPLDKLTCHCPCENTDSGNNGAIVGVTISAVAFCIVLLIIFIVIVSLVVGFAFFSKKKGENDLQMNTM